MHWSSSIWVLVVAAVGAAAFGLAVPALLFGGWMGKPQCPEDHWSRLLVTIGAVLGTLFGILNLVLWFKTGHTV